MSKVMPKHLKFPFGTEGSDCHLDAACFSTCNTSFSPTASIESFRDQFIHRSPDEYFRLAAQVTLDCLKKCGSTNCSIPVLSSDSHSSNTITSFKFADVVRDGKKDTWQPFFLYLAFGLIIFPAFVICWIFWRSKKNKVHIIRKKLFVENGGLILEKMLIRRKTCTVFTADDLRKATSNYKESIVFHRDRNEPVYKGTLLEDGVNKLVAVKRCEKIDPIQTQEFISKLVNFSLVDHTNVVKLIGCCLETPVPLLVYEFFTDKTLYDSIHNKVSFLSWERRLKIAMETSRSISYLHSSSQKPIVHGNINSSSILLDYRGTVKVAFPSFRGLLGTDGKKSDVYSFGVILAELLTGEEVLNFDRPEGEEFLAEYFVSAARGYRLLEVLEKRLVMEVNIEQLKEVAILTEKCLREEHKERPTMMEVVTKLEDVFWRLELEKDQPRFNPGKSCLEGSGKDRCSSSSSKISNVFRSVSLLFPSRQLKWEKKVITV